MRAREFIRESLNAGQVLDYVKRTHAPDEFNIEYSITDHPEWELKTIPLSQLNLDPDGEATDPYNRTNWVDYDTVRDLMPKIGSVLKSSPIVVDSQGWIIDGNHRAAAAVEAGLDKIPAYVPVKSTVAENMDHSQDDEEDALVEALESWMMMDYDDQTIKTILSSPEAEPYKDPPGGVQWLYRAIVPRDREMNSIKASGPVIAFATEMAGAITFIQSLETSDDWVIIRKPFNPADFLLDFTAMYEDIVEPDHMSRYEVEDEVWMKAVPAYTKANKQEIVYTSKEHYGDDDWRKDDYKPKSTSKSNLRRPEDEPVIMKNPGEAYYYAKDVIKGRWPEAEPYIIQGANSNDKFSIGISIIVNYARDIIGGRWPEAEPVIMKNPEYAYQYARDVIGGRWPEAEPIIMKNPVWALFYARDVIGGRWPEAEPIIMKSRRSAEYAKLFNLDTPAQDMAENFADGKGPGRPGDSQRHGIPKKATMAELEKASHAKGRKGQLARWQLNMRRGKKK